MYVRLQSKYPFFFSDNMEALVFFNRFSKNTQIPNYMKIPRVGAELFPCGRKGRRTDFECKHHCLSHNTDERIITCTDDVHLELMCEECLFRTLTAFPSQHQVHEKDNKLGNNSVDFTRRGCFRALNFPSALSHSYEFFLRHIHLLHPCSITDGKESRLLV